MHRNVIPTEMEAARPERAVRLDPIIENSCHDRVQRRLQLRKTVSQQQAQIDATRHSHKVRVCKRSAAALWRKGGEARPDQRDSPDNNSRLSQAPPSMLDAALGHESWRELS